MSKVKDKLSDMHCKYGFMPPIHSFMPVDEDVLWRMGSNGNFSYSVFTDENNKSKIEVWDKEGNLVEVWDEIVDEVEDDHGDKL